MSEATVYKSDRLTRSGAEYLAASLERQQALKRWRRLEKKRTLTGALIPVSLLLGLLVAGVLLLCFPYRAEDSVYRGAVYAVVALLGGLIVALTFVLIRLSVCASCEKAFVQCYLSEIRAEEATDAVKSETLDPVLDHALVLCACARMTVCGKKRIAAKHGAFTRDADGNRVLCGPVNGATVLIDDVEAGALDLSAEFSVFRLPAGRHTVKLKLKKEFPRLGKVLAVETPVTTVRIAEGYRVLLYTLDTRLEGGRLTYALRLSEYDDVTTFRRDLLGTDRLERLEREADLNAHLVKRARHLYRTLRTRKEFAKDILEAEGKRYRREKHRWVNRRAPLLPPDVIRAYQAEAKRLYQKLLATEDEKARAMLDEKLNALVRELSARLGVSDSATLVSLQEERLKNVLLWGQENMRYEDIAAQLLLERDTE